MTGDYVPGDGSTVTRGDRCADTNHFLPIRRAGRYSGGLNVQKFMKTMTWQEITQETNLTMSAVGLRISRTEGMEGHARACNWRLRKYLPDREWGFDVYRQSCY